MISISHIFLAWSIISELKYEPSLEDNYDKFYGQIHIIFWEKDRLIIYYIIIYDRIDYIYYWL